MKTGVSLLAVGASLVLAAGCGTAVNNTSSNTTSNTTSNTAGSASGKQVTIGFVPGMTTDPFFISMEVGAQQEAQKLGVKLVWQGASQYSPSAQTPYINAMVTKRSTRSSLAPPMQRL